MAQPVPAAPKLVVWAVRLWTASGVLFLATAAVFFAFGHSSGFAVGVGILAAAVGVAGILLGRRASTGDPRWRSTTAVFTLTATIAGMLISVVTFNPLLLVSGLVGLAGSMMAYRPTAEPWFTRGGVGG